MGRVLRILAIVACWCAPERSSLSWQNREHALIATASRHEATLVRCAAHGATVASTCEHKARVKSIRAPSVNPPGPNLSANHGFLSRASPYGTSVGGFGCLGSGVRLLYRGSCCRGPNDGLRLYLKTRHLYVYSRPITRRCVRPTPQTQEGRFTGTLPPTPTVLRRSPTDDH